MKSLSPETTYEISHFFSKNDSILAVFLIGSALRGELRKDSDIDLAILPFDGIKFSSLDLFQINGDLGYRFSMDFDLGIIGTENLVYSKEAILKGKRIFTRSEIETLKRVNTILSLYYNFQTERKIVEDAYRI